MIGKDPRPGEEHINRTREYVRVLLPALRCVAEQCGYALAVHGSLERDIDLIAAPWRICAVGPERVAEQIFNVCKCVTGFAKWCGNWDETSDFKPGPGTLPNPERKPYGRLGYSILLSGGPYIDLSVMPRENKEPDNE
jgi:hypothetical protein